MNPNDPKPTQKQSLMDWLMSLVGGGAPPPTGIQTPPVMRGRPMPRPPQQPPMHPPPQAQEETLWEVLKRRWRPVTQQGAPPRQ